MICRIVLFCAALALSAASARAQIILGETQAGETHFEIEGGHILLQAMLDGRGPYAFYFDTGAVNLLTPQIAEELGLTVKGGGFAVGFGRAHPLASGTSVSTLKIGDFQVSDQAFEVVELPHYSVDRGNRPKLAGYIGGNVVQQFVVHVDFDKRTIGFLPAAGFTYSGDGTPIDLSLSLGWSRHDQFRERPFLPVTLDGAAVNLLLDTGAGGEAVVFPGTELAAALRAKPAARLRVLSPGGIGGPVPMDMMRVSGLAIGNLPIESDPVVDVAVDALGYTPRKSEIGVLGLYALAHFNLTIDYAHNRIYLEPRHRPAPAGKGPGYWGTGLELTKDTQDRFAVMGVIAGSPAEKAGVSAGDEILSVNGRPASDLALFDYRAIEGGKEPSLAIVLGPENRKRTITLEKAVLLP
jgi:hypothetical protein